MPYTFFCHECGDGIAVDDDGCCKMCGADAETKGLSISLPEIDFCKTCEEHICKDCALRDYLQGRVEELEAEAIKDADAMRRDANIIIGLEVQRDEAWKLLRKIHAEISHGTTQADEAYILGSIEALLEGGE